MEKLLLSSHIQKTLNKILDDDESEKHNDEPEKQQERVRRGKHEILSVFRKDRNLVMFIDDLTPEVIKMEVKNKFSGYIFILCIIVSLLVLV
jgi:hypothetical protein